MSSSGAQRDSEGLKRIVARTHAIKKGGFIGKTSFHYKRERIGGERSFGGQKEKEIGRHPSKKG